MSTQTVRKQIVISDDTRAFLMKTFNCTHKHVWAAVTFRANSDSAQRIRKLALQRGGILIDGNAPKSEPVYDTAARTMEMPISGDVKILADFKAGVVSIIKGGNYVVETLVNPTIEAFMLMQQRAQKLAESHN